MKKTKIICTMGPNTNDKNIMMELAKNGMNVARFNFSHGDYNEHMERLELLKEVRKELDIPVAALLDTKGPEIRTGLLKDGKKVTLKDGQTFTLTTREVVGDDHIGHINYSGLNEDVSAGNKILIDDGLIELDVVEVKGTDIVCKVANGGELGEKKGVNVPNVKIKLPALTDKDKEDIVFGVKQGFDFIAASFVRTADCIREIKAILEAHGSSMKVIAKIENAEGIENLDAIIEASDGIMVARGDLGVEIPAEKVPYIQKMIIRKCNEQCKSVITATQMLESMVRNPRPTRAEVGDVANAVYDGTDAVMLSGETASGCYPVEAVRMMAQVAEASEPYLHDEAAPDRSREHARVALAVGMAAVQAAETLGASCIVAPTMSGRTARLMSNLRPRVPIYAVTPFPRVMRQQQLSWGVTPMLGDVQGDMQHVVENARAKVLERGLVAPGDIAVFTAGDRATSPLEDVGCGRTDVAATNAMYVVQIRED